MYAVIETGGKQYRVEVGTELQVELLDVEPGSAMEFERVLLVADGDTAAIGHPVVENASVAATVLRRERGEKTISFKYRPKARRRVKKGHRQELTLLRISDIVLDGHSAAADVREAEAARQRDRSKVEEAARRQAEADAALAAKLAAEKPVSAPSARASSATAAGDTQGQGSPKPGGRGSRGAAGASAKSAGKASAATTGDAKAGEKAASAKPATRGPASKGAAKASGTAPTRGRSAEKTQAPQPKPAPKPRAKKES